MKLLRLVISLFALALSATGGDINGRVLITKRITKKSVTPAPYDLRGMTTPSTPGDASPMTEFDRTVVFLEGGSLPARTPVTVTMEQRGLRFDPELLVIPVGSTVLFPNSDPIFHNVFSLSRTHSFDLGYYPKGDSRAVKFDRSGIVQVYCHIHTHMYSAIVVTPSPFYGKPAEDGGFSWTHIPAGHYRVIAWHKVAGLYKTEIDVPETGSVSVTLRVPVEAQSPQ